MAMAIHRVWIKIQSETPQYFDDIVHLFGPPRTLSHLGTNQDVKFETIIWNNSEKSCFKMFDPSASQQDFPPLSESDKQILTTFAAEILVSAKDYDVECGFRTTRTRCPQQIPLVSVNTDSVPEIIHVWVTS